MKHNIKKIAKHLAKCIKNMPQPLSVYCEQYNKQITGKRFQLMPDNAFILAAKQLNEILSDILSKKTTLNPTESPLMPLIWDYTNIDIFGNNVIYRNNLKDLLKQWSHLARILYKELDLNDSVILPDTVQEILPYMVIVLMYDDIISPAIKKAILEVELQETMYFAKRENYSFNTYTTSDIATISTSIGTTTGSATGSCFQLSFPVFSYQP